MSKYYYSDLSTVSPTTDDPIFCLKICRKWETFGPDKLPDALHVVMKDVRGIIIEAMVPKSEVNNFQKLLCKGNLVNLRCFDVVQRPSSSAVKNHNCLIVFRSNTFLKISNYPFYFPSVFSFANFSDIKRRSFSANGHLFDVIGRVVDVIDHIDFGVPVVHLMLQDASNSRIHCLIFGPHIPKLGNLISVLRRDITIPKVVILQLARKYISQGQVFVSTAPDVSDVIVDQFLPEIVDFKSRLPNSKKLFFCDGSVFPAECVTSSVKELLNPELTVHDLYDISCCEDVSTLQLFSPCVAPVLKLWTIGTIIEVHEERGWYFTSCSNCSIIGDSSSSEIVCPTCGENLLPSAKYKVHVTVHDIEGNSAYLILMDKLATSLIETSVSSFIQSNFKGRGKPIFPYQVSLTLIGREMLFKIKVEEHHVETTKTREYSVEKCCEHPKILKHYKDILYFHDGESTSHGRRDTPAIEYGSSDDIYEETSDESDWSSDSDT